MKEFEVIRGVSNEIEFKGLRGKYVYYLALGIGAVIFLGILLSVLGIPSLLMLIFIGSLIAGISYWVYSQNKKFGRWGKIKSAAKTKVPKVLYRI